MSGAAQPDFAAVAAKYGGVPVDSPFLRYPENIQTMARQLVDYKIPLPSGFALARPNSPWNAALQAASILDPSFDATQYGARYALRKDFTSGKTAGMLASLNMSINHLGELRKKMDQLQNRSYPWWNAVANEAETATGDPRVTNFNTAREAVASELTRLFRGTGGAEADVKAWKDVLNSSESPDQLKGAVDTAMGLLAGRVSSLEDQWTKGIGKPRDFKFLSNKSQSLIRQLGYDPDALEGGDAVALGQQPQAQTAQPAQTPGAPRDKVIWTTDANGNPVPGGQ